MLFRNEQLKAASFDANLLIKRIEEGKQLLNLNVSMGIKLAAARCLYIASANDPIVHAHTRKKQLYCISISDSAPEQ